MLDQVSSLFSLADARDQIAAVRVASAKAQAQASPGSVPAALGADTPTSNSAGRFLKTRRTGVLLSDAKAEADRLQCIVVVDRMVADPSLGPTLNSMLVSMDKQDHESEEKRADRPWPTTYCYLHKLSKEWITEWIVNFTQKESAPVTLALLNAIDAHDPGAIFRLFFYVTMLKPSDKLPRSRLNKLVCSLAFYVRQRDVGRRVAFLAAAIAANGVVDWAT